MKKVLFLIALAAIVGGSTLVYADGTAGCVMNGDKKAPCKCKTNFVPGNRHSAPASAPAKA